MKIQLKLVAVVILTLTLSAIGQDAPTTSPAAPSVAADRQTPRGALKVMAAAMAKGDSNGMRESLYAGTPAEEKMRGAIADFSAVMARLRKAMEANYGKAEATQLLGDADGGLDANNERVDAAVESINGDDATITIADPNSTGKQKVRMKKGALGWQVVMEDNGRTVPPELMIAKADELNAQASGLAEAAAEIEQNKNKTIEQSKQLIEAKMTAAMQRKAQSQSSTQPATQPAHSHDGHDHGPGHNHAGHE